MRWKLLLSVPVLLLLLAAGYFAAQENGIPATLTIPESNHNIDSVRVVYNQTQQSADTVVYAIPEVRTQYRLPKHLQPSNNRYGLRVELKSPGKRWFKKQLWVEGTDSCNKVEGEPPGHIQRLACAIDQDSPLPLSGVTCSAYYDGYPDDECEGTAACVTCGRVKVCGSNPQCY